LIHAAKDYGAFVRGAIESGLKGGDEVLACSDELTMEEIVRIWGEGEEGSVVVVAVPRRR
jgi:hypothetical protein